jgi:hypothetical protein
MTTAYTSLLGLALPVTGELSGTWGDTVNTAITSLLDTAVAGTTSITTDSDITLTTTTGASNQARQAIILWNPASGTTTRNITAPAQSKIYTVINASGGTQSIVIRGAGPTTGVTIAKGESAMVAWNGSDFVKVSSSGGAITFTDLTVTGNTILGDAAADTLTVNATSTFASPVNFQGLVKLPSTGRSAAAALTTTNPAFLYGVASTYTDTTSSGTVAFAPFYLLAQPTLSTSNVTTYTNAATLYIANVPTTGGSATITNAYSLYVAAGNSYFGGTITANGQLLFPTAAAQSAGSIAKNATYGLSLYGVTGSTYDLTLLNGSSSPALGILAGTTTVDLPGALIVAGNITVSGGVANTVPFLNGSKVISTVNGVGGLAWSGSMLGLTTGLASWGNAFKGVQVSNGTSYVRGGGNSSHVVNNVYNDNTDWRYIGNAAAAQIILGDGNMTFQTAATGTPGNVATFGTGIYIDQLGEGVGLFGAGAAIPTGMASFLALGDSDTGIAWESDGAIHTYVNGVKTITYYSGATIFQQNVGIFRSPSYPLDVGGNARIMGVTAYQDNILRMSLPSGTSGNYNQILFREQADTATTASITAYGSAYGSSLNNVLRFGTTAGYAMIGQAGVFGIQTTPTTDWSTASVLQIEQAAVVGSADATRVMQGAYFATTLGGGAARLNGTYAPSQYLQNGGAHTFYSAGTGAAGSSISWTTLGAFNANGILSLSAQALNWDGSSARAFEASASGGLRGSLYQTASGVLGIANNYYYNGGDYYGASGYASRYYQYAGEHFFQVAGNSSGAISWTNAMAINRTGTLLATGDAASDGSIKGFQTGTGFVERDYNYSFGGARTIVVAGTYNYKIEITVMAVGNTAAAAIGEGRWIAGRRDYSGANHIYASGNLVNSCVSFSTSQSIVGAQCTYTVTVSNSQDGANNHWVVKVRLINTDSFSIT